MSAPATYQDIGDSISGHVGQIEIQRPPHNYFDNALIRATEREGRRSGRGEAVRRRRLPAVERRPSAAFGRRPADGTL